MLSHGNTCSDPRNLKAAQSPPIKSNAQTRRARPPRGTCSPVYNSPMIALAKYPPIETLHVCKCCEFFSIISSLTVEAVSLRCHWVAYAGKSGLKVSSLFCFPPRQGCRYYLLPKDFLKRKKAGNGVIFPVVCI